ncbi:MULTISPECIES: methyltransferase [Nostoc]|uniref:Methyltransferase n=2 Tax=Nostoc TaxID=1177 RepID=A0ABR8IGS4_9NOSO|nr:MULTISPECIES: methyltransferase [Nostoc]MBD2565250.1 methyltransferase [Nostoc linckia FACHB-391]MBD2650383.1 methyltransferase [Nostoc foliaceum FACHB-393]
MNATTSITIQKPITDELLLWNLLFADTGRQVLLVAYDIKLFPLLSQKPRTLAEICDGLKICQRPAEAILAVLASIELVELENNLYSLSPLAKDYLIESSPTYFGALLEMMIFDDRKHISSFENLKKALFTNNPPGNKLRESLGKNHELMRAITFGNNVKFIRGFISSMHGPSMAAALVWPELIDLSGYKLFVDIGGGSAAHSIGATSKWPNLRAVVLDLPPVCEIAQEFITRYRLQSRIVTQEFDMWSDSFPISDLHFYSSVYQDWQPEKCHILTQNSFNSLLPGGRIILHEMLFNDQKTGPFPVAINNLNTSLKLGGQQYSGQELSMMLEQAGFIDIEIKPASSYWSIITGRKP